MAPEQLLPIDEPEAPKKEAPKKLSRKGIQAIVEDVMIRAGARTHHEVITAVIKHFGLTPKSSRSVKPIVEKHYDTMVQRIVGAVVLSSIREGVEDFKSINSRIHRERYTIEDSIIIEIIRDQKKAYREAASQRAKDRIQVQKDATKGQTDVDPAQRKAAVGMYKENLRASISSQMEKQKEKRVLAIQSVYKLEYLREAVQNEKRVMIHRGIYRSREVYLKTIYKDEDSEEVINVNLLFRRIVGGKKLSVNFDISALYEKWTAKGGGDACRKNLITLNKVLGFPDFQEALWFLGLVLHNAESAPDESLTMVREKFFPFIYQLESDLTEEFVTDMVEKKYYQLTQEGNR